MNRISVDATLILIALSAGLAAPATAQQATRERPSAASVTLDQVSTPDRSRNGDATTTDLNVPQPATAPRAAATTSGNITARTDSRALATAPLAGDDRCDPTTGRARSALCRRKLEARAGDYARPAPAPVTAEGRLLLLVGPGATSDPGAKDSSGLPNLGGPNSPAEQLAGALQATDTSSSNGAATSTAANPLPPGVPPIVVIPGK